jgi:type I restriction enzyme M protein
MDLFFNSTLSKEDNLLKRFEEIHDYIYSNDGLSPQQTLEEFIKVLFIKICDENNAQSQFSITTEEWNELKIGQSIPSFIERIMALFEQTKQIYQDSCCLLGC